MAAIMPLGLLAWMQNMMSASIPIGWLYVAMLMALLLVIPIGAVFVNWIGTLAGGVLRMRAPLVFALAAISTLSFGLILELIQSVIPVNWLLGGHHRLDRGQRLRAGRRTDARRASPRSTTGSRR